MIPNVFVSSTVQDLHHLRDALRDVIADLGYNPVMSEYGDIGYLPSASAEDSCYIAIRQCQLALLIIGRRYGDPKPHGLSVTHREFHAAREAGIPVITLIDKDVMSFKAVFDANQTASTLQFPGVDHPAKLFALVDEIGSYEVNNGFQQFATVADARLHLKRQLAHFVGELLQRRGGGLGPDVKQILAEIKTLRHELGKTLDVQKTRPFMKTLRYLLDKRAGHLAGLAELLFGDLETGVTAILETTQFQDFVEKAGWSLKIEVELESDSARVSELLQKHRLAMSYSEFVGKRDSPYALWFATKDRQLVVNVLGYELLDRQFKDARRFA